jgi:hypothetical protein
MPTQSIEVYKWDTIMQVVVDIQALDAMIIISEAQNKNMLYFL